MQENFASLITSYGALGPVDSPQVTAACSQAAVDNNSPAQVRDQTLALHTQTHTIDVRRTDKHTHTRTHNATMQGKNKNSCTCSVTDKSMR